MSMEDSVTLMGIDKTTSPVERDEEARSGKPSAPLWRRLAPLGVIGSVLALAWSMGWFQYFSVGSLIQHQEFLEQTVASNFFFSALAFVAIYMVLVAVSFPGASILTVAAGLLFGGVTGAFLSVIGATAGSVIIFLIAKSSLGDFLGDKAGPFVGRMVEGFKNDSFLYLLTIRLTPVFPFWVVNIVPALLNMRLGPYALATFLGIIPGTFAYAYIGAGLTSIIEAQKAADPGCVAAGTCSIDLKSLVTTEIIIAMVAMAAISILPVIIKKLRKKPLEQGE